MPDKISVNQKSPMPLKAVALALSICCLFGGNQVASKIALQQFPPMLCAALAFTLAGISLGVYARFNIILFITNSNKF